MRWLDRCPFAGPFPRNAVGRTERTEVRPMDLKSYVAARDRLTCRKLTAQCWDGGTEDATGRRYRAVPGRTPAVVL